MCDISRFAKVQMCYKTYGDEIWINRSLSKIKIMSIFNIFKTERPVSENKSTLVGQTAKLEKAKEIMHGANKDPLKKESSDGLTVKGNKTITEVFSKQELKDVGYGGGDMPL